MKLNKYINILLLNLFFLTNIYAQNIDFNIIYNYNNKINKLEKYIDNYIYITGDIYPTRNKLSLYYNIDYNFFNNIINEKCDINNNLCLNTGDGLNFNLNYNNYILTITNVIKQNFNNKWINSFKLNLKNNYILNNNDIKIPLSEKLINYISFIKTLNDNNIYINLKKPTDNTIYTWIKPLGNGNLALMLKNNNNIWLNIKLINNDYNLFNIYLKNENIDINNLKLLNNTRINLIQSDNSISTYIYNNNNWILYNKSNQDNNNSSNNNNSNNNNLINDSNIYQIACIDFNKDINASNIGTNDLLINQPLSFIKKENNNTIYWNTGKYYITKNINDLNTLSNNNNDIAYICSNSGLSYDSLEYLNGHWTYLVNSFNDISKYNDYPIDTYISTWNTISLKNNNYIFKKTFNSINDIIWKSTNLFKNDYTFPINTKYEISFSSKSRDVFENLDLNKIYLTSQSDCVIKANCNGDTKYQHNDWLIDNLYTWLYDGNELIDIFKINNIKDMYIGVNSNKNSYLYNNIIYLKKYDSNNNVIYKEKGTNTYITAKGQIVPITYLDNNNIPLFPKKVLSDLNVDNDIDISAKNVTYINSIIQINDLLQLIKWNSLNGLQANIIGDKGIYTLYKNNNYIYWENDINNKIIADGTRIKLPLLTSNDYTYLTTKIGCDNNNIEDNNLLCRYSYSGLKYSKDNRFYQWYSISTPKSINGYIDFKTYNNMNDLYNNDKNIGKIINSNIIYQKILDDNNNTCYHELNNPLNIITKNNQLIPLNYIDYTGNIINKIRIPTNRTCSNIKFIDNNIIFNDRIDLLNWENAKVLDQAYLNINNYIYIARNNSNNKLYFESNKANEKITIFDKNIFENISFIDSNTKYLTLIKSNDFLYNNGLQIKNNLKKVKGIFSLNDQDLYLSFQNPRTDIINQSLVDIFINDSLNNIYNYLDYNYIYYYNGNSYILLQKENFHNEKCYIDKTNSPYKYYLKQTGTYSPYNDNLPNNKNCLNTMIYNNMLVIDNMNTVLDKWDLALNGYKVIFSNLDNNDIYTLYKDNNYRYWAKNTDLTQDTLNNNEPNEVYAQNRNEIPNIDPSLTNMLIYTSSIYNEETNLDLGTQYLYAFKTINDLNTTIKNYSNSVNNLTDIYTPTNMNMYIFDDINNVTNNNNDNVQIVEGACKLIVDGYWDYNQGNNGNTPRSDYTGNGISNWATTPYNNGHKANDIPLFVQNNKLFFSHNYPFDYNGDSNKEINGGFIANVDVNNQVKEINSTVVNSFYNNSYTVIDNNIKNSIFYSGENYLKIKYKTNCTTTNCAAHYKNIQFRTDGTISLVQGYSNNSNDPNLPIHDTSYYYGIEFQNYQFLSSLNYSVLPYTQGIGAELSYLQGSTVANLHDFYTGDDGTKPNSSFLSDFYIWNVKNYLVFMLNNPSSPKKIVYLNNDFSAMGYVFNNSTYQVQHILGSTNNILLLSTKNINDNKYYLISINSSNNINIIGSSLNDIKPIDKPKHESNFRTSGNLYFLCDHNGNGLDLCYTNGTSINYVNTNAILNKDSIIEYNNIVYYGNYSDNKIYSWDETNINMINDTFDTNNGNIFFKYPIIFNNKIYFQRSDECGPFIKEGNNNTTNQKWAVLHYLIL